MAQALVFLACYGTSDFKPVSTELRDLNWVYFQFGKGLKCVLTDGSVCWTCVETLCSWQTLKSSVMCATRSKIVERSFSYSSAGNRMASAMEACSYYKA